MNSQLIIRQETELDYRFVEELTRNAFWNIHTPGTDVHLALHNLRKHEDFINELDFVAEVDKKIAGHICYSKGIVFNNDGKQNEIVCFGPVSVDPAYQKKGIGSALIKYSLKKAEELGYPAVAIYGDPRYYSRFGFHCGEYYDIQTEDGFYAACLLVKELTENGMKKIQGRFVESKGLFVQEKALNNYDRMFPPKEKKETPSQFEFQVLSSLRYQVPEQ